MQNLTHDYVKPSKTNITIHNCILIFLFISFSVSIIDLFQSKLILFIITVLLGLIFIIKNNKIDNIVYYIIIYMILVQLFAMIRFSELITGRFISLGLTITKFLLAYFIIKLSGKSFLVNFEKTSFTFIVIGLPLFLLTQYYPQFSQIFKHFDIDSSEIQKIYGGWNIFIFVHSGWAGFRFCGYSGEPGSMAMMITISWVIYILNYGINIKFKTIVYLIAMIFTFSTTGYLVLILFTIFYALNSQKTSFLLLGLPLLISLLFILPRIWKLEFMQDKINMYIDFDQELKSIYGGYEQYKGSNNIGRLSAISIGAKDIATWPIGHGTVTSGRTKNFYGDTLSGANGLINFTILWGILGFLFLIHSLYLFIYNKYNIYLKSKFFLLISILLVFSSNPVMHSPVLYTLILYPYLYKNVFTQ